MGDIVTQRNIGSFIISFSSVFPTNSAAATINGATIDRVAHNMPLSTTLHTVVGTNSGAPTSFSVTSTLQHSPDGSTWTTYQPDGVNNAVAPALSAVSSENELDIDLSMAYRYIRISTVVAFVGGTSPAAQVAAWLMLGGEPLQPAI